MELPSTSNRILYDVPCGVCQDHSSGKHYGVYACDGCAGFFKRSVRRDRQYTCKARNPGGCLVDKAHRNQCRACRFAKCLQAGMNRDAVQHERGPRNSTIRRQMAMLMKDQQEMAPVVNQTGPPALNLTLQNTDIRPPAPLPIFNPYHSNFEFLTLPVKPPFPPLVMTMLPLTKSENICEAAARLLFTNVKWAKNLATFDSLSLSDRILLLEESWKDMFLLGAAQFLQPLDMQLLLNRCNPNLNRSDVETIEKVIAEILKLRPDINEYSCLRAMALFKTNLTDGFVRGINFKTLQDLPAVAALQYQSQKVLAEYTIRTYPLHVTRLSQLMHLIPVIRTVNSSTLVNLFFKNTIGEIPIERIISDMYRTGKDFV